MAETPCISLQSAAVSFGGTPLFTDLTIMLSRGQKACLVGRNGSGKSTLLKTLAGAIDLTHGKRFIQPGFSLSYLAQEVASMPSLTILDYVTTRAHKAQPIELYQAEAILDRLSLNPQALLETLSGGEKRRASLAQALVNQPEILLLDEPTNHLDIGTIEWLEEELKSYRGALLVISHDRRFLENVTTESFWLERGKLHFLNKGYRYFEAWSEEILEKEEKELVRLERKLEVETEWLHKGVTARRRRNQGRLRRLMGLRETKQQYVGPKGRIVIPPLTAETESRLVLEARNISKVLDTSTGPLTIAKDLSLRVLKGDRVGIIGNNGTGKTTLLKLLLQEMSVDKGTIRTAKNLKVAYCDQTRSPLKPNLNLWETICEQGGDHVTVQGRSRHVVAYLKDFLFDEKQIFNAVGTLSGGERNRLLLAKALTQPSSLLVLDEPTNDLDMDTLEILEEILGDYEGTLLVVSHDRDFLDRLVTSIVAVEGQGEIYEYAGGYEDYLRQKRDSTKPSSKPALKLKVTTPSLKTVTKLSYKDERELQALTAKIPELTAKKKSLEQSLEDTNLFASNPERFGQVLNQLETTKQQLEEAESRWLELESLKESLQKEGA